MPNSYFQFKQFIIIQDKSAMKVTTDGCLFGAWTATEIANLKFTIHDVLDIGTGTGLLSLMVAQKNNAHIDAIEINEESAIQANENVLASPWKENIDAIHANVLQWQSDKKYDVIVSNPPFYEKEIISQQEKKNTAHHSHQLKFAELIAVIKQRLNPEGCFFLLLPAKREREIENVLAREKLYIQKKMVIKQSVTHDPFRIMLQGGFTKANEIFVNEMAITDNDKKYTAAFTSLLTDYYLHL